MNCRREGRGSSESLLHPNDLRAWEKSFELAVAIFKIADRIPEGLGLSLCGQMRVTALSVPSHLARAQSGVAPRQYLRGLCLARCALTELETHIDLCRELGYASDLDVRRIRAQVRGARRLIAEIVNRLHAAPRDSAREVLRSERCARPGGGQDRRRAHLKERRCPSRRS